MTEIDPSFVEGAPDVDPPEAAAPNAASEPETADANAAENRLARALRELHARGAKVAEEVHEIASPSSERLVIGAVAGAVLLGGLVLVVIARGRRGRARPRRVGAGRRVGAEIARELVTRMAVSAGGVIAAGLTQQLLLPMLEQRLQALQPQPAAPRRARARRSAEPK